MTIKVLPNIQTRNVLCLSKSRSVEIADLRGFVLASGARSMILVLVWITSKIRASATLRMAYRPVRPLLK